MYVYTCVNCECGGQDILLELALFPHVGFRNSIQFIRLSCKYL